MRTIKTAISTFAILTALGASAAFAEPKPVPFADLPEAAQQTVLDEAPNVDPRQFSAVRTEEGTYRVFYVEGRTQHEILVRSDGKIEGMRRTTY